MKLNKKIIPILGTIVVLGGGILVSRIYNYSQGKYKNINNTKVAIVVDDEKVKSIPNRGYYKVDVDCGEAKGEWDYNAWSLKVDKIEEGTKCNVTFTSGLEKEQYQEYLNAGVNARRNTYRGKNITEYKNLPEEDEMNLYKQIKNCTFDDIYVGDYIVSDTLKDYKEQNVIWLIADINNYLYSGDTALETCHATIIPAYPLINAQMNSSNTTAGGYKGSEMYTATLGTAIDSNTTDVLNKYLVPDFNGHILKYRNLVSNAMEKGRSNQFGVSSGDNGGASSGWEWDDRYLDLMSEVNVYGTTVRSSSGYDVGIDNREYAIFQLKPELINNYNNIKFSYWLKGVASSTAFTVAGTESEANSTIASGLFGVRPRFLID